MLKLPFQKLQIWHKSLLLAAKVYSITKDFPRDEVFGITSQIRRAAVSISSNIAEGSQRSSNKEFAHFISIARGSLAELETQIIISSDVGYLPKEQCENIVGEIHEIARMMNSFSRTLATNH